MKQSNSFKTWLLTRAINRDDPIGDVATEVQEDPWFPNNTHRLNYVKKHMRKSGIWGWPLSQEFSKALNDAFRLYIHETTCGWPELNLDQPNRKGI